MLTSGGHWANGLRVGGVVRGSLSPIPNAHTELCTSPVFGVVRFTLFTLCTFDLAAPQSPERNAKGAFRLGCLPPPAPRSRRPKGRR